MKYVAAFFAIALLLTASAETVEARGKRKLKKVPTLWEQIIGK